MPNNNGQSVRQKPPVSPRHASVESHALTQAFSGPIPPPAVLAEYDSRFPGFAERIMSMAEREAETRHELEKTNAEIASRDIAAARTETRRGQWMSFAITAMAFAAAIYCAKIDQPWVAGIIAGATLASGVSTIMNRCGSSAPNGSTDVKR